MRRKRSLIQAFTRLTIEEKVVAISALVGIVSCFLPWYGISSRFLNQWTSGFGSIGYIVGYITFGISTLSIYILAAPSLGFPMTRLLNSKTSMVFLFAQSTLLLFVLSTVYARYAAYDTPGSSVRFGLYTALFASFIGMIGAVIGWKKHTSEMKRKGLYEDFVHLPRQHEVSDHDEMSPEFVEKPRAVSSFRRETTPVHAEEKAQEPTLNI